MDPRLILLTAPSLVVLVLLVWHSALTLPRLRAAGFWAGVTGFGILRSVGVKWVTEKGLGAPVPYEIHQPLFPLFGVPLQEVAGWAIVTYLGWWLGYRFAAARASRLPRLFPQVAWACMFLAAISWAVEAAAVAAGWWHWTLNVSNPLFLNVPFIGIVDWLFVGIDFLLPFVVITATAFAGRHARFLTLFALPTHFGAHLFVGRISDAVPIPIFHLVHWGLAAVVVWLAIRSTVVDEAFDARAERRYGWLPTVGLAVIVVDVVGVELLLVRRPELLASVLPVLVVALLALRPMSGFIAGAGALVAAVWLAPLALAAVPAAVGAGLEWGRRHRWSAVVALAALALTAYGVHAASAKQERELLQRLARAVAARDGGNLAAAEEELRAASRNSPGSHVPAALLGEIYYRTDRLAEARAAFLSVVRIKQSHLAAYRHLAVVDLRRGDAASARRFAEEGLAIAPADAELQYLAHRASGRAIEPVVERAATLGPSQMQALVSLAYEVGDADGAAGIAERAVNVWPREPWFHRTRLRLALARNDDAAARRAVAAWRRSLPEDREAARAAETMNMR